MNTSIELVTFKLAEGVKPEQLVATNDAMQAFLTQQPGFIYRSLSQDEDGQWFDIVYWLDQTSAKTGGEAFMRSAACAALMPLIDGPSVVMRHMDALSEILVKRDAA
ncbi:MAG: hypothetical protein MJK10_08465 [Pseudomonadales bacterium]|nr:hypothetical protein [Pseudomonadales bacterium]NRA15858.1 hypothetical protein [Oceanospirillaceae bacterium]